MTEIKNKSIMTLIHDAQVIKYWLLENDGEITEKIEHYMTEHQAELIAKSDRLAYIIDVLESDIDFLKQKEEELYEARKRAQNGLDKLKSKIMDLLEVVENNTLEGDLYRFKFRKTAGKVIIENEELVPEKYKIIKQEVTIDKKLLAQDLKTDSQISGCHLQYEPTLIKQVK